MVRNFYITAFTRFAILFFMLVNGFFMSNISNAKICPLLGIIIHCKHSQFLKFWGLMNVGF